MNADLRAYPVTGLDAGLEQALLAADLPIDDILDGGRLFFRFEIAGEVVGYGGYEPHGVYALIRSVVVMPTPVDAGSAGGSFGLSWTR